jgi:hypothetical protein
LAYGALAWGLVLSAGRIAAHGASKSCMPARLSVGRNCFAGEGYFGNGQPQIILPCLKNAILTSALILTAFFGGLRIFVD